MGGIRLSVLIPVILFAALAAVFAAYLYYIASGRKDIREIPSALIDKPVPAFSLPPITGGDGKGNDTGGLSSDDLKGRVALVNVFASWCPPCRVEHPILMRLAAEGVTIFGINYKDKPDDARNFLVTLGNPYTKIGADENGRGAIEWGVYGYPETFVVDRSGHIRYRHVGAITPKDLAEIIRPLLNELAK